MTSPADDGSVLSLSTTLPCRFFQQVMSLGSREHTSRAISIPPTEQAGRVKSGEHTRTKDTSLTHKTNDVIDCSPGELSFTDLFAES